MTRFKEGDYVIVYAKWNTRFSHNSKVKKVYKNGNFILDSEDYPKKQFRQDGCAVSYDLGGLMAIKITK